MEVVTTGQRERKRKETGHSFGLASCLGGCFGSFLKLRACSERI